MAKEADPAAVIETIRSSIEASRRGSRRVRARRFRELFGYQAWSAQRRDHVERLLKEAGIVVQPARVSWCRTEIIWRDRMERRDFMRASFGATAALGIGAALGG